MKKIILLLLFVFMFVGCAKFWDQAEAKGGVIGSHKARYIIVNQSGGLIMDIYKLNSAIVQSPSGSDGWLFLGPDNSPIYLGGDVKTIRNPHDDIWKQYHEYHMEFEYMTYRQKYNSYHEDIQLDMDSQ